MSRLWLPSDLPSSKLLSWHDVADGSTLTLSGSGATAWNDKSGNGRHLTQTPGAGSPDYWANGAGTGIPTLTFGATEGLKTSAAYIYDAAAVAQTRIIGVFRAPHSGTSSQMITESSTASNTPIYQIFGADNAAGTGICRTFIRNDSNVTLSGTPYEPSSITPWDNTFNLVTVADDAARLYWEENAQGDANRAYTRTGTMTLTHLQLGIVLRTNLSNSEPFEVAEWCVVRGLTATELELIEGYLAHKNGVASKLPTAHPYYSSAPTVVDPLYIGADGQSVVYLGSVAVGSKYLGPRSLF